jgi:hypothetical protein
MKSEIKTLLELLYSGKINKNEFLQKYFGDNGFDEEMVLKLFKKGIANNDADIIEEGVVLLYTGAFNIHFFIFELCQLLQMDWHTKHEDIATLLMQAKEPSTVECLYNASELAFDYLDYDDTYQLGRKCIKALSAIGDENAISKLSLLSGSNIHKIAEYAKKELHSKGLE